MKIFLLLFASIAYSQCNSLSGTLAATGTSATVSNTAVTAQCTSWTVSITTTPAVFSYTANLQGNFGSGFINIGNTCSTLGSCLITYSGAFPNQLQLNLSAFSSSVQGLINYTFSGAGQATTGAGGATILGPYIVSSGNKFIMETGWPFTALFSCSFLDANTSTPVTSVNGDTQLTFVAASAVNSWCFTSATTSIESEFRAVQTGATDSFVGIALCDATNGKLYSLEAANSSGIMTYFTAVWTLAGCTAGTPSAPTTQAYRTVSSGTHHLKLVKSGSSILAQVSQDAGGTYTTLNTFTSIGSISKAMVDLRAGGAETVTGTFLSTVVQ